MLTGNQAFAQSQTKSNLRFIDKRVADTFGTDEAIFLNYLHYWISKGYGVVYNGKRWIYNTYEQWIKQLPGKITRDRFKRMIKRLLDSGVLMIEKLKAHEWKQTNFYTINEEALKAKITMPNASGGYNLSSGGLSTDDLYTENTTDKTESGGGNVFDLDLVDPWFANEEEEAKEEPQEVNCPSPLVENSPDSGDDQSSEPIEKKLQLVPFHKELLRILQFCDGINNPWAYAQKCVDNLRAGSQSSIELYEKWAETGEIVVEDIMGEQKPKASEKGKNPSSVKPNQEGVSQPTYKDKETTNVDELKEWHIKPEDQGLLEQGYNVGDIYPEFIQWATPRLKYHPDLSEYAAKSHAIKRLKLEQQLALDMWRDFKRLLAQELEDKKKKESKGLPYFTPSWMQLSADVPISEAKQASLELGEALIEEKEGIEATRDQAQSQIEGKQPKALTTGDENEESSPKEEANGNDPKGKASDEPKEEISETWYETIKGMILDAQKIGFTWLIISAINDAIAEVDEEEKAQIIDLAKEYLPLEYLNQIEIEF